MLALHFGAGNIGRGFIGQLLHQSDYRICFVDVNQAVIDDINTLGKYEIEIVGDSKKRIEVTNICAINSNDKKVVIEKIIKADIITTALGANILKFIAPVIAKGIVARIKANNKPINIIACENMIGGSTVLKELVYKNLTENEIALIKDKIGFPNSAVDRIVPLQNNEEKLLVKTEEFFEWDVELENLVGDKPNIKGIIYVDNLQAYIERKLFAVNAVHASIAYLGNIYGKKTIYEATCDENIMQIVQTVTQETKYLLVRKYNFDEEKHQNYVNMIISRFSSPYISDDIKRVARNPIRKISVNERLLSPAKQLLSYGILAKGLSKVIAGALCFKNEDDTEAVELQNYIANNGVEKALEKYCDLEMSSKLTQEIVKNYNLFKK